MQSAAGSRKANLSKIHCRQLAAFVSVSVRDSVLLSSMASSQSLSRIVQLSATINEAVARLQNVLSTKGLPSPSFDEDAKFSLPEEVSETQDAILDATAELHDFLLDPVTLIGEHAGVSMNTSSPIPPFADKVGFVAQ